MNIIGRLAKLESRIPEPEPEVRCTACGGLHRYGSVETWKAIHHGEQACNCKPCGCWRVGLEVQLRAIRNLPEDLLPEGAGAIKAQLQGKPDPSQLSDAEIRQILHN